MRFRWNRKLLLISVMAILTFTPFYVTKRTELSTKTAETTVGDESVPADQTILKSNALQDLQASFFFNSDQPQQEQSDEDVASPYKASIEQNNKHIYDQYNITKSPGLKLFYFAIPTTGSRMITNAVRLLCKLGHWKLSTNQYPITTSSSTLWRVEGCCAHESYKEKVINGVMDVMVEHWENTYEQMHTYLHRFYPPDRTLTVLMIREPIEYLMARMAKTNKASGSNEQIIGRFRESLPKWIRKEQLGQRQTVNPIINAQSLYLGWKRGDNQSLTEMLDYVREMKLVTTSEHSVWTLRYLACFTGWDKRIIRMDQKRIGQLSLRIGAPFLQIDIRNAHVPRGATLAKMLTEEETAHLRRVLYADYELYNLALQMFHNMNSTMYKYCPEL